MRMLESPDRHQDGDSDRRSRRHRRRLAASTCPTRGSSSSSTRRLVHVPPINARSTPEASSAATPETASIAYVLAETSRVRIRCRASVHHRHDESSSRSSPTIADADADISAPDISLRFGTALGSHPVHGIGSCRARSKRSHRAGRRDERSQRGSKPARPAADPSPPKPSSNDSTADGRSRRSDIDASHTSYTQLGNLDTATEKARRDAPSIPVCDITGPTLRHVAASSLIAGGLSVAAVQAVLGHATPSETLDVYTHLWPTDEDRTRAAIESSARAWL